MALGDYTPTSWANGTSPAINETNLNHLETKVKELDTGQAGIVQMYAGATIPSGWLLCNGQAVSRSTYAALFTAIGTTWGVGNGSTTFNVPDMREAAPVGVGTFSAVTGTTHGTQVAADAYTLGQFKDDQGQGHQHRPLNESTIQMQELTQTTTSEVFAACIGTACTINNAGNTGSPITDGSNGNPRMGTTTHGKRIGLNFIIKI